jgi:hypothetical protein
MGKIIKTLMLAALATATMNGYINNNRCCDYGLNFEWRGAAFIPLKCEQREIFGRALPAVQFEISGRLCGDVLMCNDEILLFGNVAWTGKKGCSPGFGYPIRLNLIPLTIGLEYQMNVCNWFDFYFGVGGVVSFLRNKTSDGFCCIRNHRTGGGVMTKLGFRYEICHFLIDIFADYYFTNFKHLQNSIVNVNHKFSAFFVGLGLGRHF